MRERYSRGTPEEKGAKVIASEQLADSVLDYLNDEERNTVLREHQSTAFEDLEKFFRDGHHRGYIELPTGTGKTVLFVELAKALLNTPDGAPTPNILVVTPTQDLVRQTVGRKGQKGFGEFASELDVRPYYSGASPTDRENFTRADIGVTTYASFNLLHRQADFIPAHELGSAAIAEVYYDKLAHHLRGTEEMQNKEERSWSPETAFAYSQKKAQDFMQKRFQGQFMGDPMIEAFDIIFLDEAHHALESTVAGELVNALPESKYVIGFTATPDANEERQLSKVLPEKIHSLSLAESIEMGLLSPIVPIAIESGIRIKGSDIFNQTGDYMDDKISYLARSKERNDLILNAAEVFANNGVGTIISCIAGGDAAQAREIADDLVARGISAAVVYNKISPEDRAKIYREFEDGEIDVLTFIGVLGEGWDSQRAKALINARPTRSSIFATQRPGRVARPGGVAFTVDIYDEYEAGPPIGVADILDENGARYGQVFGDVTDEEAEYVATLLDELAAATPTMQYLHSTYRQQREILAGIPKMVRGSVTIEGREYVIPARVSSSFHKVTHEILLKAAELQDITLEQVDGNLNGMVRTAYDRNTASRLIWSLPIVNEQKYYVDQERTKWVSPTGLATLFGKRYPDVSDSTIEQALKAADIDLEWIPAAVPKGYVSRFDKKYNALRMFKANQDTIKMVDAALKSFYDSHSPDTSQS